MLNFLLDVGVVATIYGLLAISLNLQAGLSGLFNFGLIAFFGIGAYATGLGGLHGVPWPAAILIGFAVSAVVGAAIGRLGRTLRVEYWGIATLAIAELLRLIANNSDSLTRGAYGISTIKPFFTSFSTFDGELAWFGVGVAAVAVCAFVAHRITSGQFGRVLRMIREREELAAALGHDVVRAKMRVMAISAPMAALAGSLYTHYITYVGPAELEPFGTFLVFTMVIVGGLGSLPGVIIGAVAVQLLYDLTRLLNDVISISPATIGGLRILVVGAALLVFLLFRPSGLVPERLRRVGETTPLGWLRKPIAAAYARR